MSGDKQRLFFALCPDVDIRRAITTWQELFLKRKERWIPSDYLHVTLIFLGEVSVEIRDKIMNLAMKIALPNFNLKLDHIDYRNREKIIWFGASQSPSDLYLLVNELRHLAAMCGIKLEKRAFKAHVTLARKANKPATFSIVPVTWNVKTFSLFKSELGPDGARYEILCTFPLRERIKPDGFGDCPT